MFPGRCWPATQGGQRYLPSSWKAKGTQTSYRRGAGAWPGEEAARASAWEGAIVRKGLKEGIGNIRCWDSPRRFGLVISIYIPSSHFSCALSTATSEDEVNMWIKGLNWLVADTLRAATPLQIER